MPQPFTLSRPPSRVIYARQAVLVGADISAPANPAIVLDGGAATTYDQVVEAAISTTDPDTTGYEMLLYGADVDPTFDADIQTTEGASTWKPFDPLLDIKFAAPAAVGRQVFLKLRDGGGNTSAAVSDTIDLLEPDTVLDAGPTQGSTTAIDTGTFSFHGVGDADTFQRRLDGDTWDDVTDPYVTPVLADGEHTVEIRAVSAELGADPSPVSRTWTIDTTPPGTQIDTGPTEGQSVAQDFVTFTFSGTGGDVDHFEVRKDGGVWVEATSPDIWEDLEEGPHTFEVRAVDEIDNADPTPAIRNFVIDLPPNTIIVEGPAEGIRIFVPTTTFHFVSIDPDFDYFEVKVDDADWATVESPLILDDLVDGAHTFEVRAVDAAGHADPTPATRSWYVDLGVRKYRLVPRAISMMHTLPPYYWDSVDMQAIVDTEARELDRLEDGINLVQNNFTASSSAEYLRFHELLMGLAPDTDLEEQQRRQLVLTFIRRLSRAGEGSAWQERLDDVINAPWVYADFHPENLRGLNWDKFDGDTLSDAWTMAAGTNTDFTMGAGVLVPSTTNAVEAYRTSEEIANAQSVVRFKLGNITGAVRATIKRLASGSSLEAHWSNDVLALRKIVGGTPTVLDSTAAALEAGKVYWLRGRVVGNACIVQIFATDPQLLAGPLYTKSFTLTGADITTFGTNIKGSTGFAWSDAAPSWQIEDYRSMESGLTVDLDEVHIRVPFTDDDFRAESLIRLARQITPAHLEITVFHDAGWFILGKHQLGLDTL